MIVRALLRGDDSKAEMLCEQLVAAHGRPWPDGRIPIVFAEHGWGSRDDKGRRIAFVRAVIEMLNETFRCASGLCEGND